MGIANHRLATATGIVALLGVVACDRPRALERGGETTTTGASTPERSNASLESERCAADRRGVDEHLALFDDLDFNVFSNQRWEQFSKSHADDIVVHWPDGHSTQGLAKHIEDMKWMFSYAPDTKIKEHPVKVGSGDLTSVIGIMEGTFTKPMKMPNGKIAQATNKPFKLKMNTVGRWRDGKMSEEYLFWDNGEFMKQIGLAPP
jgi:hypothetical protein